MEGHQFAFPTNAAMAGTVTVRTTKVSIKRPMPTMNLICVMVERLPNSRPNIEAAKMTPTEVMTPLVERTAGMMPERMPERDSSRIRVINKRTLQSVATLFAQEVAGYVGSSVERRGKNAERDAVWSIMALQELLDEWIVAVWQNRPHDGLRDPVTPGKALTPNEKYAALVEFAGYVPVPLSGEDYIELLPAKWRTINSYGIRVNNRTYDAKALNPYRHQNSGVQAHKGQWEVHHDPYDVSRIWLRNHHDDGWIMANWTHLRTTPIPFGEGVWQQARVVLANRGQDKPTEAELARAASDLLDRAASGPPADADKSDAKQRRVAGRNRVTAQPTWPRPAPTRPDDGQEEPALQADAQNDQDDTEIDVSKGDSAASVRCAQGGQTVATMTEIAAVSQLEERRQPTTTLEGWRRFVDADPPEFTLLDDCDWDSLSDAERTAYDEARVAHHSELVVVTTTAIQEIRKQGRILTLLNQREIGARRGLIISGGAATGKTTAIKQLGRFHELLTRDRFHDDDRISVVYVTAPPKGSPRKLAMEFARFLGLPTLNPRMNVTDISDAVCQVLIDARTDIVVVDFTDRN